ncbi:MAG: hypothetical protein MMC33_006820 [Icmadophila ericetorum]|nr:hypothetical protein [Icmadophila ericetorum]
MGSPESYSTENQSSNNKVNMSFIYDRFAYDALGNLFFRQYLTLEQFLKVSSNNTPNGKLHWYEEYQLWAVLLQYTQLKWLNDYEGSTIPKFLDASVRAGLAMSASSATNIAKFDIDAMDSGRCLEESPSPNITPLSPRLLQGQTVTALCKNLTSHFPTVWSISEPIQT